MSKINMVNEFGERFTSKNDGQEIANGLAPKTSLAAVFAIADPSTATAEDCADKINEILAALKVVS